MKTVQDHIALVNKQIAFFERTTRLKGTQNVGFYDELVQDHKALLNYLESQAPVPAPMSAEPSARVKIIAATIGKKEYPKEVLALIREDQPSEWENKILQVAQNHTGTDITISDIVKGLWDEFEIIASSREDISNKVGGLVRRDLMERVEGKKGVYRLKA